MVDSVVVSVVATLMPTPRLRVPPCGPWRASKWGPRARPKRQPLHPATLPRQTPNGPCTPSTPQPGQTRNRWYSEVKHRNGYLCCSTRNTAPGCLALSGNLPPRIAPDCPASPRLAPHPMGLQLGGLIGSEVSLNIGNPTGRQMLKGHPFRSWPAE